MFSFFKQKKTDPKKSLKKVLGDYALPSFPRVALETLKKIRNPESSASTVANILSGDPGLTVHVLRTANSAFFSPSKKIENLSQAVALVGFSQLESLILSIAIKSSVPRGSSQIYDARQFWHTSAKRGVLASSLGTILCPTKQSEVFTAGFLQDLALPILVQHRPKAYGPIFEQWLNSDQSLTELEQAAFGWDHAEVATWICSEWDLPENITSAIGGHHGDHNDLYDCPAPVALVAHLRFPDKESDIETLVEITSTEYGIPHDTTRQLIESSFKMAEELARSMS